MRFSILLVSLLIAQTGLHYADSLRENGDYEVALVVYDSLRRQADISDTTLIHIYLSGAKCLANLKHQGKGAVDRVWSKVSPASQRYPGLEHLVILPRVDKRGSRQAKQSRESLHLYFFRIDMNKLYPCSKK